MSRGTGLNAHSEILLSNPRPLGEGKGEGDNAIAGFALTSIVSQRRGKKSYPRPFRERARVRVNALSVLNNLKAFGLT